MDSDPLFALAPYEKTHSSGEIKSQGVSFNSKAEEPADEMRELLPSPDKVELSAKIDFTESLITYHLTSNKNLNEYIFTVNQTLQIKAENSTNLEASENFFNLSQSKKDRFTPYGLDIRG